MNLRNNVIISFLYTTSFWKLCIFAEVQDKMNKVTEVHRAENGMLYDQKLFN